MKIGIVAPGGFDRSGTERVIPVFLWLVERLARDHEVHVFTLRQGPDEEQYPLLGATVHNIGDRDGARRSAELVVRTVKSIGREHALGSFTVLHGLWASASGLAAALAGRVWKIPTVVSVAGGEMASVPKIGYGSQLSLKSRIEVALCLRLADVVTSASEWMCRAIRRRRADVRHVVMGVDTSLFQAGSPPQPLPGGEGLSDSRSAFEHASYPLLPLSSGEGLGRGARLLHVASLNHVKDQPTLLRAFLEIVTAEPSARLDVIGVDTLNGDIQRLAHDLGLDGSVTFHGFQRSEVVASYLQNAHLLLHSSLSEMGPIVCLEAAACGIPSVGTSVGLIDDLSPEAASAVPVGDHHALARAALALLRNSNVRRAMGHRAFEFASNYDADWTASQFEQIYADLVCRTGASVLGARLQASSLWKKTKLKATKSTNSRPSPYAVGPLLEQSPIHAHSLACSSDRMEWDSPAQSKRSEILKG